MNSGPSENDPPQRPLNGTAEIAREVLGHVKKVEHEVSALTNTVNDHKIETKDRLRRAAQVAKIAARHSRDAVRKVDEHHKHWEGKLEQTNSILSDMKTQQRIHAFIFTAVGTVFLTVFGVFLKAALDSSHKEAEQDRKRIESKLDEAREEDRGRNE
jgi:hypothetical protein